MSLFNVFLLSVFLDFSQIQLLFPILAKIQLQKIIIALACFGLISKSELLNNARTSMSVPTARMFMFLVLWIILSVPFGVYPGQSLGFITKSYWKLLVSVLLVVAYVSTIEDLRKLIWAYIVGVGLLALVALSSYANGRMEINADVYDANDTALIFLVALPFAFWNYKSTKGLKSILSIIICVLLIVGIVKTGSRGGFLGLTVVFLVLLFQLKKIEKRNLFSLLLILGIIALLFINYTDQSYITRISSIFNPTQDYNVTASTGRLQIWERGFQMMLMNPLLGVGIFNFISAEGMLFAEVGSRYQAAHNSFVQIGAEIGFPGLIAFVLLLFKTVKNMMLITSLSINENNAASQDCKFISLPATAALIGFMVSGSFLSAAYISSLYFLLAISFSLLSINNIFRIKQ